MNINGKNYDAISSGGEYSYARLTDHISMSTDYYGFTPVVLDIPEVIPREYDVRNIEIYKYEYPNWNYMGDYDTCPSNKFPELEGYHNKIIEYRNNTSSVRETLCISKTISIGIISQPGMGKSTLIRMLATTLNMNINIAPDMEVDQDVWEQVDGIVIVEDYDRFTNDIRIPNDVNSISLMFYTSNSYLKNAHELDLLFKFEDHTLNTYKRSVNIVFPEGRDDIVQVLMDSKISMREANVLLVNSMTTSSPVDYIKENIGKIALSTNSLSSISLTDFDDNDWC